MSKIAFFSGNLSNGGGTERVLSIIANGLAERGHEVMIMSLTGTGDSYYELNKAIKVHWICSRGLQKDILRNLKYIERILDEEKPEYLIDVDIILCFYSRILRKRCGIRYWISWEHFNYFTKFDHNQGLRSLARKTVSRKSDCLVVLSDEDKRYYRENLNPSCRLKRIYNPAVFEEPAATVKKEKIILAVGRLTKIKGYDMLLKSWAALEKGYPEWSLLLVGDGEERAALEKQAEDAGLRNVHFEGNVKNVEDYYARADIFVLPSRNEGFAMVLLEAMAYALPIVAFNCKAGVSEAVEDNVSGYLAEAENVDAFTECLAKMIGNGSEKRAEMGAKGQKKLQEFKKDRILDQWEKLFRILVEYK